MSTDQHPAPATTAGAAPGVETLRRKLRPVLERMSTDERATYVQQVRESRQLPWWARDAAIDLAHEVAITVALREGLRS